MKNMKKTAILMACVLFIGVLIGGCNNTLPVQARKDDFRMNYINKYADIELWEDPETGVQYLIYSDRVGHAGAGGICPRYNADGTLFVD